MRAKPLTRAQLERVVVIGYIFDSKTHGPDQRCEWNSYSSGLTDEGFEALMRGDYQASHDDPDENGRGLYRRKLTEIEITENIGLTSVHTGYGVLFSTLEVEPLAPIEGGR